VKMFPTLERAIVVEQIHDINQLIVDKDMVGKGLGYLRDDRMGSSVSFVDKAFDLRGKVKLSDTYSNALLGK